MFQALFMRAMYGGNYWLAVRKTFFAETVSMNMVMVGMFPTMAILMHALPGADDPTRALFWGVMSAATMAGMITAYPINSWMVSRELKHGMMTAIPGHKGKEGGDMSTSMDMETMPQGMAHSSKNDHRATTLPKVQVLAVSLGTFAGLALALWITARFVPIVFTLK